MRTQPGWLAMGLGAAALFLVMTAPASAQKKFGGGTVGSGGRPFNTFGTPGYYSTYDPLGYNYYLNRPGYNFLPRVGLGGFGTLGGYGTLGA